MYITDLKNERKFQSSVFVDDEFWAKIDNDVLTQNNVKIGTSVNSEFLSKLRFDSDYKRAKNKALYLLSFKDYSKKELIEKLKKDFCQEASEKTIVRMEELGFINDAAFAKKRAQDLLFNKCFSKRRVEFELAQKGIDKSLICCALDELECDPVEQIKLLIEKKYKSAYSDKKIKRRAIAFLQRHGYLWDDIKQVFDTSV